jgi:hypothetical protein
VKWVSFGLSALRVRKSMTMLNRLNCVEITSFQFDFQSGNQRSVRCVGDGSQVGFVQQFPGGKASVRLCVVVMLLPVLFSPKFAAKS